jgi:hypothetical protein
MAKPRLKHFLWYFKCLNCQRRKINPIGKKNPIDLVFPLIGLQTEAASSDVMKDLLESNLVRFSWEKFCSIFNHSTKKQQLLVYEASVKLLRFI